MKKLFILLVLILGFLFPSSTVKATPNSFSCFVTMSNTCYYYAEFYQKCAVEMNGYSHGYNYNEVSVWCEGDLILRDVLPVGEHIPEYIDGHYQLWPNLDSFILGAVDAYGTLKVERFVTLIPHVFGQGTGQGGE